jgi:hypothetical protein
VLAAWVLLFAAGTVIGSRVFSRLKDFQRGSGSESVQVPASWPKPPTARLERVAQVAGAVSAYTSADPMLRAPNGHASLVVVSMRKNARHDDPDDGRGCDALTRFW